MRKKIAAGNWKMNKDLSETESFLSELKEQVFPEGVQVVIAPPFTNLHHAFVSLKDHPVEVAAQNMHQEAEGAYTGEVSAGMLKSIGIELVLLGHSERRSYFKEDNTLLAQKVTRALENNMKIIFCIGEELSDRQAGSHFEVIKAQLKEGLFHIEESAWSEIVIAYEPVWAIGTGETATPGQAQEMHRFIRETIAEAFSIGTADSVSILYGGSVNPDNAAEIFRQPDVDGGLVGGASLKADSFMKIVNSF